MQKPLKSIVLLSPSHTVGLEQVLKEDEVLALYNESPSHAVGLEQ